MKIQITTLILLAFGAGSAFGQGGTTALGNQVPLSGRGNQSGAVAATESAIAGTNASVNTINPGLQVSGPYTGSVSGAARPFAGKLSLKEAIERGLAFNLGNRNLSFATRQAEAQAALARSALMPNITASMTGTETQVNLAAQGFHFNLPPTIPLSFPTVVGPFHNVDARARLTETVFDLAVRNNYKSAQEAIRANQLVAEDAKDLVVLAVGGAYLQTKAAEARIVSEKAQLAASQSLFDQSSQQRAAGLIAQIDVNRAEVQVLTHRQRMASLENDLAKQKINLARLTGLPPNAKYELTDEIPFTVAPVLTEEDAVREALAKRSDIQAAEAQIRVAETARKAVKGSRMPSLAFAADYGAIGENPASSHGTFTVSGSLRIPIWEGGRYEADLAQANLAIEQRQAELEDTKSKVESEVRNAFLDLQAASSQVEVARKNLDVAKETLTLAQQKLDAGVTDSTEITQAQAAIASADLDLINSIFAHNLAKLSLGRTQGTIADQVDKYLKVQ